MIYKKIVTFQIFLITNFVILLFFILILKNTNLISKIMIYKIFLTFQIFNK